MWRDLEEEAIYVGLTLDYFWKLNPKQYAKHCKIYLKKEEHYFQTQDVLNHILGQYIGVAFNNPKEYPKKPLLDKITEKKKTPQTLEDMERIALQNTLMMGGVVNNSR